MRKVRNVTFIAGLLILCFALLANYLRFATITEPAFWFCIGFATALFVAAIGFAVAPIFCKKKKCCAEPVENPEKGKK